MVRVEFKNVGQGDSIFIEWDGNGKLQYGIIDCHIYNGSNLILDELIKRNVTELEFVVLSHFHHDHFSGFSQLLDYCVANNIIIKKFLHTFKTDYYRIIDSGTNSYRIQKEIQSFWNSYVKADAIILEIINAVVGYSPIELYKGVFVKFLAPNERDSIKLVKQQVAWDNKTSTTQPNFNLVSTIIELYNNTDSIIFTSDAVVSSFERIQGFVTKKVNMVQVPHHGSDNNHVEDFWSGLTIVKNCPAVYSVGDVKRDKIPKKNVVEFFDKNNFHNMSTNFVYGLVEYHGTAVTIPLPVMKRSLLLGTRSILKSSTLKVVPHASSRFSGNQLFKFNL